MQRFILIVSLLLIACPASARMYQWVNPASGRTQMSGTPPAWYRADPAETGGRKPPRVLVFENGELIDDTAIAVSETQRQQLRDEAFRGADLEARAAAATASPAPPTAAALPAGGESGGNFSEPPTQSLDKTRPAPATSDATIDKMKALIEQWDKQKTEQAKTLIQTQPAPAAPSSH